MCCVSNCFVLRFVGLVELQISRQRNLGTGLRTGGSGELPTDEFAQHGGVVVVFLHVIEIGQQAPHQIEVIQRRLSIGELQGQQQILHRQLAVTRHGLLGRRQLLSQFLFDSFIRFLLQTPRHSRQEELLALHFRHGFDGVCLRLFKRGRGRLRLDPRAATPPGMPANRLRASS